MALRSNLRARARSLSTLLTVLAAPLVVGHMLLFDGDGGDGGTEGDPPQPKDDKTNPDAKLGAAGEKALREERAARAKAERDLKTMRKELDDLRSAGATEAERAVAKAKEEGKAEALAAANARVLRSEIKAAAAGRLADPADAVRLLDPDDLTDEHGEVDSRKLTAAIDELIKAKPYLAGKARANGDGGGGPRGRDGAPSMDDWLRSQARSRR